MTNFKTLLAEGEEMTGTDDNITTGPVLIGTKRALRTIEELAKTIEDEGQKKEFLFVARKELGMAIRHASSVEVLAPATIEAMYHKIIWR